MVTAAPPPPAPAPAPTNRHALLVWLAAHAPAERDRACESVFGCESAPASVATRAEHGVGSTAGDAEPAPGSDPWAASGRASAESLARDEVGHHTSGIAPLVRAVLEVPIHPEDVVVDLGSGLGKAAFVLHLASGARVHGIERDHELATRAAASAVRLGLDDVRFEHGDARSAVLHEGTVFYLYLPFTGDTLDAVMHRLHAIAARHAIVVVTLGLDLRRYPWLTARATDAFWLTIYDGGGAGAVPRRASSSSELAAREAENAEGRARRAIAYET